MNKALALCLGVSLVANVVIGLMYFGEKVMLAQAKSDNTEVNRQVNQLKNETSKKEKTLDSLQQSKANYEIEHSQEIKRFVETTFKELFNYDNKSYAARFDQIRNNVDPSVISKLSGSGEKGNTQIEFSNQVKALSVYLRAVDQDQATALVNMETQYAVGSSPFPRKSQMYEVTLHRQKNKWSIGKLNLLGSFEPYGGN